MEVPALRVNLPADRALRFPLPFAGEHEIRRNLVERLEQERKRVRRRLLEREHADVVVIEAQMRPMTLERRVTACRSRETCRAGVGRASAFSGV